VIENATNVYASNSICNKLKAEIVFSDKLNDIAILKVNITLKPIPFNIITINKDIGSNVFTLGFPYVQSMGKDVKLTNGIINSSSGFENDTRYYQFSAEIQPGNSGGPLFDSDGNVVGLVSAKHNKATNAGYALKSKFIVDFIKLTNPTLLKKKC
jgi:serine protease Do